MGGNAADETIRIDADNVEARDVDGELVILDLKTSNYIAGNRSTALLWPMLVEGTTRQAMADRLVAEYEIDRRLAVSDCENLVDALSSLGLLHE